jgi:hypothetical protein
MKPTQMILGVFLVLTSVSAIASMPHPNGEQIACGSTGTAALVSPGLAGSSSGHVTSSGACAAALADLKSKLFSASGASCVTEDCPENEACEGIVDLQPTDTIHKPKKDHVTGLWSCTVTLPLGKFYLPACTRCA